MSDMPPAVERPPSPAGWGGSTAAGWGGTPPVGNGWGANTWGANEADGGWGASAAHPPSANGWGGTAASGAGWGGNTAGGWNSNGTAAAGGWGVGIAAGASAGTIPPPPGATYANDAGRWQTQGDENLWDDHDNGFRTGYSNDRGRANYTAHESRPYDSSFSSNSAANPYPSGNAFAPQATQHPSSFDTSNYASLRQQTLSAPPDAAYMQPSWVTAMGASPFAQQSSPYDSMALTRRPGSSMAMARPHMPFNNSPASTLGRSISGDGSRYGRGLPDRPSEWRRDFSMRSGLASLLPRSRQRSSFSPDHGTQLRPSLHPFLRLSYNDPPVSYDLRLPPRTLMFREVRREILASDLTRFACEPPLPYMRLVHPRLPWYIDVHASNPTGVNLGDLFQAIWNCLRCPIQKADFLNDELSDSDRDKISHAWRVRCNGDAFEQGCGVRRVDFLRRHVVFEGLVKGRNGTWEMKTRKVD